MLSKRYESTEFTQLFTTRESTGIIHSSNVSEFRLNGNRTPYMQALVNIQPPTNSV